MNQNITKIQTERRKFPRSNVQIWAVEKAENSTSFHLLKNLSIDGFFIEKKLPFPVGAQVHLELELGDEKIPLKGKIIDNYRDPVSGYTGAGVQFIDMHKGDVGKIEAYLKSRGHEK